MDTINLAGWLGGWHIFYYRFRCECYIKLYFEPSKCNLQTNVGIIIISSVETRVEDLLPCAFQLNLHEHLYCFGMFACLVTYLPASEPLPNPEFSSKN